MLFCTCVPGVVCVPLACVLSMPVYLYSCGALRLGLDSYRYTLDLTIHYSGANTYLIFKALISVVSAIYCNLTAISYSESQFCSMNEHILTTWRIALMTVLSQELLNPHDNLHLNKQTFSYLRLWPISSPSRPIPFVWIVSPNSSTIFVNTISHDTLQSSIQTMYLLLLKIGFSAIISIFFFLSD